MAAAKANLRGKREFSTLPVTPGSNRFSPMRKQPRPNSSATKSDAPEIVKQLKDLIGKFSVKYRGAQLWNSLPDNLRNQKSYSSFKNLIKIYIQHNLHLD